MLAAHPELAPALLPQVSAAQRQQLNRYSNTLQDQQRFKAAANELLLEAAKPRQGTQEALRRGGEGARQGGVEAELEQALSGATATARELSERLQARMSHDE